jgi:hypothetical protein
MFKSIAKHLDAKTLCLAAGLGLLALGLAGEAGAACMNTDKMISPASFSTTGGLKLVPALYTPGTRSDFFFQRVNDDGDDDGIVGLWEFKMTGFSVDYGTQAWHSDGTELMFSGAQNPATGDVCQGVWRKVGQNTYTLNHIAMGWMAPGGPFGVRVHFHMVVKLDPGHHSFSGSYHAAVFAVSPDDPFSESVKLAEGGGNVTANRVHPD